MGLISRPTKTSSGSTDFSADTDAFATEVNDDVNPLYNAINGNLDEANLPALPWANITGNPDPEDIDDTSATQAEHDTTQDPGDPESPPTGTGSRTLATNVAEEIQQLRYAALRQAVGLGVVRRDTDGPTNESATWFEHPVRGRNLVVNGQFNLYTDTTTDAAPDGWTLISTPVIPGPTAVATALGEGLELEFTASAGANEGIQQSIEGLKASTRYLLRVRGRAATGDTINITTTGADGAVYANAVLVLPQTNTGDVSTIVVTDATPANIAILIQSSAAADNWFLESVELIEMNEQPPSVQTEGYTTQAERTTAYAVGAAWADVTDLEVAVVCPGSGYEIVATTDCTFDQASAAAGVGYGARIDENGSPVRTGNEVSNGQNQGGHISLTYVNESPTAGTTYTYKVQAVRGAAATVDLSPLAVAPVGQTDSTLTVSVRRRG